MDQHCFRVSLQQQLLRFLEQKKVDACEERYLPLMISRYHTVAGKKIVDEAGDLVMF